jgi:hypothetical protein
VVRRKVKALSPIEVQRLTTPGMNFVGEVAGLALLRQGDWRTELDTALLDSRQAARHGAGRIS